MLLILVLLTLPPFEDVVLPVLREKKFGLFLLLKVFYLAAFGNITALMGFRSKLDEGPSMCRFGFYYYARVLIK